MDISPFYELRSRLYCTASAGCSVIEEDFRLKRAVEAFRPLSEANKAFGKFYLMCQKLFSSENTAAALADCIALADALAVTQGTFADPCGTVKICRSTGTVPVNEPYSQLKRLSDKIRKCRTSRIELTVQENGMLTDPRILAVYVDCSGINSIYLEEFTETMFNVYGSKLVPMLKESVNLCDEKATGIQLDCIQRFSGAAENDWFLSLAGNEEAPKNVRIKAIEALACSEENEERLIELYSTEKGKLKNAALMALARLSSARAEELLKKLTEKYTGSYADYIAASGGEVCTEFVRMSLEYALNNKVSLDDKKRPTITAAVGMLGNKKDVLDCFMRAGEWYYENYVKDKDIIDHTAFYDLNKPLAENVFFHSEPEYRNMILSLYERFPDVFFASRFYLELMENPDTVFTTLYNDAKRRIPQTLNFINSLYRLSDGTYRLPCSVTHCDFRVYNTVLFESLPDNLLYFLSDTDEIDDRRKLFRKTFRVSSDYLKNAEARCRALARLMEICSAEDHPRVKVAAEKLAWAMSETYPTEISVNILGECSERQLDGIVQRYVINRLEKWRSVVRSYTLSSLKVPEELLVSELKALAEKLPGMKRSIDQVHLDSQLTEIYRVLQKHGIIYDERK